ncbi:cell division protein FtsA [Ignavigranum ruoffiae]|uniref:cell division protein FtsA n=1 Tax=Ignavigranum ruoffiae TaxID=89093 RepID=UPI00205C8EE1|nr:cell division protein FtsA [Ignavigranum ruoffiae]UPQ85314.1 cell division protein FtsA [Ignavigranum ruoffiae]
MRNPEIYVSLDIGTTSIKVVVAETNNGRVNIIGVGNEKSRGLSRGVIVDIDETVYSIQQAVEQAERKAGVKINEVIVGVPSNQLAIEDCHGMIAVASDNREITARDVDNVISAAKVRSVPPEREIISIIPEEFIVDGFNGIRDPRGMIGVRLELYARLITGPKTIIHNIRRCVQKAGLQISELVLQPHAIAQVALNCDEREFGTVVIDMGGGQTSASILYDNQLKYSFVDQEGGDFVTKDISIVLNTSLDSAERVKREYGYAIASQTSAEEYFPVETVGKKEPIRVDEHYLAEIIEARIAQIFETIREDLERVEALDLPGGFVITGGASALPGVIDLAKRYFGGKVRIFVPEEMGMRNPIYTTGLGLIQYAAQLDDIHRIAQGTFRTVRPDHNENRRPQSGFERHVRHETREPIASQNQYGYPSQMEAEPRSEYPERFDSYPTSQVEDDLDDNVYYEDYYVDETNPNHSDRVGNFTDKVRSFFQTFFD